MRSILLGLLPCCLIAATTVVAGPDLVTPANYFDLQGRSLTFTPSGTGYVVTNTEAGPLDPEGSRLGAAGFVFSRGNGWRVSLPFEFRFGGRAYRELFVNASGSLTFDRPEAQLYPERDTWPAGTMRSVGSALRGRSLAGTERMIAVLWGIHDNPSARVSVSSTAERFAVTWRVERYRTPNEGYGSMGPNVFQVSLAPAGTITMTFETVSERDGITGVFPGTPPAARVVSTINDASGDAPDSRIELASIEAADAGEFLRFTFQSGGDILRTAPEGTVWYRIFLRRGSALCEIGLWVDTRVRGYAGRDCASAAVAPLIAGRRLDLFVEKARVGMVAGDNATWTGDILWGRSATVTLVDGAPTAALPAFTAPAPFDFSSVGGGMDGAISEVFHYPSVDKGVAAHTRYVYRIWEPEEEFFAAFFDFRIDDLHNHQGTATPINAAIRGLGGNYGTPQNGATGYGSNKLLAATGPIYLGQRFAENVADAAREYRNWAFGVGWLAHEFSHRWGAALRLRTAEAPAAMTLLNPDCLCHWQSFLDTRSVTQVWRQFSDSEYPEVSTMSGGYFDEMADGTFRRRAVPYLTPFGYSSLDLYTLGLISAAETNPGFLIANPTVTGAVIRGTKTPVRMEDIVAANGERLPNVADSPKEMVIGLYLMIEPGRPPDAGKLRDLEGIEANLIEWFSTATGGRARMRAATPRLRLKPDSLVIDSGDGQSGAPGAKADAPVGIRVTSGGYPVPALSVSLTGKNMTVPETVVTDIQGVAWFTPEFGAEPGDGTVELRAGELDPVTARFTIVVPE